MPRSRSSPTATGSAPRARPLEAMRAGVDVVYQGVFVDGAGAASPTSSCASRRRPSSGLELRGARHEARAHARSPRTSSSSASTTSSSRGSRGRRRSGSTSCSAPASRRASARRSSAPTTGASARGSSEFVADPPRDRAVPERPLRHLRLQARLRRVVGRGRPPLPRRRDPPARRSSSSRAAGITTLAELGRAPAEPRRRASPPRRSRRSASRPSCSCWAREHGDDRYVLLQPQPESGLRAPARALAGRPLLRLRGQPVLGQATAASSTSGGSSTPTGDFTPLWAHDHETRARGVRAVRRPRARAARAITRTCTSTTTPPTRSPR